MGVARRISARVSRGGKVGRLGINSALRYLSLSRVVPHSRSFCMLKRGATRARAHTRSSRISRRIISLARVLAKAHLLLSLSLSIKIAEKEKREVEKKK